MIPGRGYWVKTNDEGLKIQVEGQLNATPPDMTPGWNLVGFSNLQPVPVEDILIGIPGAVQSIWSYNDGNWWVYNVQNPEFSDLKNIEPGIGYWIKTVD